MMSIGIVISLFTTFLLFPTVLILFSKHEEEHFNTAEIPFTSKVAHIASAAIAAIVEYYSLCKKNKIELRVFGLSKHVEEIFRITGVDNLLVLHQDLKSAAKGLEETEKVDKTSAKPKKKKKAKSKDKLVKTSEPVKESLAKVIILKGALEQDTIIKMDKKAKTIFAKGTFHIIIDCQKLTKLASSGIAMLLDWQKTANSKGVKLCLFGANSLIIEILEITGATNVIKIYDTKDEALNSLKAKKSKVKKSKKS